MIVSIIDVGKPERMMGPQFGLIPVFKDLWAGEAVTVSTGSTSASRILPRPSAVILDVLPNFVVTYSYLTICPADVHLRVASHQRHL
jgi:hypothetical protein